MKVMAAEEFVQAKRVNEALTATAERRVLIWVAKRLPEWVTPDQLTVMGLAAQVGAGIGYALARYDRGALLLVIACVALNWLGDSLDGTLARVRGQERPRFGFYVDHVVDVLGAAAMMAGLGCSGLLHRETAAAMLVAFLVLASESFLAAYTLGRFELSQGMFGPTEIRLLLIAGNVALLRSPYATVFGHRWMLFDVGGWIATMCMAGMALTLVARHTGRLYRDEPLP